MDKNMIFFVDLTWVIQQSDEGYRAVLFSIIYYNI